VLVRSPRIATPDTTNSNGEKIPKKAPAAKPTIGENPRFVPARAPTAAPNTTQAKNILPSSDDAHYSV
jgi:hypothetical protein